MCESSQKSEWQGETINFQRLYIQKLKLSQNISVLYFIYRILLI